MGNQLKKQETWGKHSYVEEYKDFDIILIARGMNDSTPMEEIEMSFTVSDETY